MTSHHGHRSRRQGDRRSVGVDEVAETRHVYAAASDLQLKQKSEIRRDDGEQLHTQTNTHTGYTMEDMEGLLPYFIPPWATRRVDCR